MKCLKISIYGGKEQALLPENGPVDGHADNEGPDHAVHSFIVFLQFNYSCSQQFFSNGKLPG